jgi:hypothetical protein
LNDTDKNKQIVGIQIIIMKKKVFLAWPTELNSEIQVSNDFNSWIDRIKFGIIEAYPAEIMIRARLFAKKPPINNAPIRRI